MGKMKISILLILNTIESNDVKIIHNYNFFNLRLPGRKFAHSYLLAYEVVN